MQIKSRSSFVYRYRNMCSQSTLVLVLLLLSKLLSKASHETQQPETETALVRLTFWDGQRLANAIHVGEGTAQTAGVALPPVHCVEPKFLHLQVLVEINVIALGRQIQLILAAIVLRLGTQKGSLVHGRLSIEEPNPIALHGIDLEAVEVGRYVERFLQLEVGQCSEVFVAADGTHHGGYKFKVFGEAFAVVLLTEKDVASEDRAGTIDEGLGRMGEGVGCLESIGVDFSCKGYR